MTAPIIRIPTNTRPTDDPLYPAPYLRVAGGVVVAQGCPAEGGMDDLEDAFTFLSMLRYGVDMGYRDIDIEIEDGGARWGLRGLRIKALQPAVLKAGDTAYPDIESAMAAHPEAIQVAPTFPTRDVTGKWLVPQTAAHESGAEIPTGAVVTETTMSGTWTAIVAATSVEVIEPQAPPPEA